MDDYGFEVREIDYLKSEMSESEDKITWILFVILTIIVTVVIVISILLIVNYDATMIYMNRFIDIIKHLKM